MNGLTAGTDTWRTFGLAREDEKGECRVDVCVVFRDEAVSLAEESFSLLQCAGERAGGADRGIMVAMGRSDSVSVLSSLGL